MKIEFQNSVRRFSLLSHLLEIKIAWIKPCQWWNEIYWKQIPGFLMWWDRGEGRVILWVFQPEIFNLSPLGIILQVTSTVAYSVKEVGQINIGRVSSTLMIKVVPTQLFLFGDLPYHRHNYKQFSATGSSR